MQRLGKFFRIDYVATIQVVTEAEPVVSIQDVTQSNLAQILPPLLVVTPLRQTVAFVVAGNVGVEVVVSQASSLRVASCFSFHTPSSLNCASSSSSRWPGDKDSPVAMVSKQSQNACEVNCSGAKPHSDERILPRYQSATSFWGPGWQMR